MPVDQAVVPICDVVQMARPAIGGWVRYQACSNGIQFDVSMASEQVVLAIDKAGPESTFPQSARPAVDGIDDTYVAAANVLHHGADRAGGGRSDQKMYMVGHEDIGMDLAATTCSRFRQAL